MVPADAAIRAPTIDNGINNAVKTTAIPVNRIALVVALFMEDANDKIPTKAKSGTAIRVNANTPNPISFILKDLPILLNIINDKLIDISSNESEAAASKEEPGFNLESS